MPGHIRGDIRRECRANLPVLGRGQAYYLRGGDKYSFKRFTVKPKTTFDASSTPRMGELKKTMFLASLDAEDKKRIGDLYQTFGLTKLSQSSEMSIDSLSQDSKMLDDDVEDEVSNLGRRDDDDNEDGTPEMDGDGE